MNRVSFYMQMIWIGMFCQSGNYMNRGCIQSSSGTSPPKFFPSDLGTLYVTNNYCFETGSMTGILENLKWESLKKRRGDSRLILLYKGLKGADNR